MTSLRPKLKGFLHSRVLNEEVHLPVLLKKLQKILISCCLIPVTISVFRSCVERRYVHGYELTTADNLKFRRLQLHAG